MSNELKIKLTAQQQKEITDATGKSVTELSIDLASTGGLTQSDLDNVVGGEALHNGTHIVKSA